jgi:hypothetical protein
MSVAKAQSRAQFEVFVLRKFLYYKCATGCGGRVNRQKQYRRLLVNLSMVAREPVIDFEDLFAERHVEVRTLIVKDNCEFHETNCTLILRLLISK